MQTGGVGCEEEFHYGQILTLKVFGVWLARAGMRLKGRRLLALALIYDEGLRLDAAQLGNVTPQIVRDWVMRFNANGPDGLVDGKAPGPKSLSNDGWRAALAKAIERGATPYLDRVVRWCLCDLAWWC